MNYLGNRSIFREKILWSSIYLVSLPFPVKSTETDTLSVNFSESLFRQKIVSMDFKNTDIKDIIRVLASQYGLNIFIEDNVSRRLTLHLENVTLGDALHYITEQNGLLMEKYGSIYKITDSPPPQPPPPELKKWNMFCKNGLISLDLKNENLADALYQISLCSGVNIFLERFIDDEITGYIHDMPFEQAMYQLLKNNGYLFRKEGSAYQVRRFRSGSPDTKSPGRQFWINTRRERIDLELESAELNQVLTELSRQLNINLFLYGNISGTVTARADDLTLNQCLNLILSGNEYTYKQSGNIYLVGEKTNKLLSSSRLFQLSHLKVDGILEMFPQKISEKAEFKIIREHNAVLVNASQDIINEIASIVEDLDRPIPQILIEALVVDYNYQDIREIQLEAGLKSGSTIDSTYGGGDKWFPAIDIYWTGNNANHYLNKLGHFLGVRNIGRLPDDFYLKVKAMEAVGKANIRSKPQIATLNGHTADITIGQTQYYILKTQTPIRDPSQIYIQETQEFQTIEANITLKITPWVSATGEITAEIHPEFNNPVGQFSSTVPPTIQRRALNSTVRMLDGETIVLGGLIQSAETVSITRIPLLGSLPILGRLFQNRNHNISKSELVIYITPHLSYSTELLYEG